MTAAERMQRQRDRRKAGLVRLEFWVHQSQVRAIEVAVQRLMEKAVPSPQNPCSYCDAGPCIADGRAVGIWPPPLCSETGTNPQP
jgi:hypothetical protein